MARLSVRHQNVFSDGKAASGIVVLAVGEIFSLRAKADADLAGNRTAFAEFSEVTMDLIEALRPQVVVSSVLGRNFDCVDLAERLSEIGFDGRYRLIAHGMPEPELVRREIQSLFPDLRVELDTPVN